MGGTEQSGESKRSKLMEQLHRLLDAINNHPPYDMKRGTMHTIPVASFDCMPGLCVFIKTVSSLPPSGWQSEFHSAANQGAVTDKITDHNYDLLYEKYLHSLRSGGKSIATYGSPTSVLFQPSNYKLRCVAIG
jgi:hypothetical protein